MVTDMEREFSTFVCWMTLIGKCGGCRDFVEIEFCASIAVAGRCRYVSVCMLR